jgi:cysteine synthase
MPGAELIEVPAVPYSNPNNYVKVSGRLAERLNASEPERRDSGPTSSTIPPTAGPYRNDRPEIWEQTGGKVDGFICAVGTGGTLAGVGMALKARNPNDHHRARRSDGRGALQLLHDRRTEIVRGRRSPKASGRAASPQSRGRADRCAFQIPTRRRCR